MNRIEVFNLLFYPLRRVSRWIPDETGKKATLEEVYVPNYLAIAMWFLLGLAVGRLL